MTSVNVATEIPTDVADWAEPVRIQAAGIRFWMGRMPAVEMVLPVKDVVMLALDNVLHREDFSLDATMPGNRTESPTWTHQIEAGIRENAHRLLIGSFVFAVDPEAVSAPPWPNPEMGHLVDVQKVGIRSGYSLFILDAQHRTRALRDLWNKIKALPGDEVAHLLGRSSVPVIIVLEKDPLEIARMFVTMASTKAIPQALVVAMDRHKPVNRLGIEVAKRWKLLANGGPAGRLEYQSNSPKGQHLYTAAAVRAAAANVLVGFKDRNPLQREQGVDAALAKFEADPAQALGRAAVWIAATFDKAADKFPGWRQLLTGEIDAGDFRDQYLLASASGLFVVAGTLAAARAAGLDAGRVLDAVSTLPWKKSNSVIERPEGENGPMVLRHKFFEGLLVNSELVRDEKGALRETYKTAGGNRTAYMAATRKVIEHVAKTKEFEMLASRDVLIAVGLESQRGPGRPRRGVKSAAA